MPWTNLSSFTDFSALLRGKWLPSVWATALVALLTLAGFLIWDSYDQYEATLAQEYRFLESHARFGDEQIGGALRSIDLMLQRVVDDQLSSPPLSPDVVRSRHLDFLKNFPEIHLLITTNNQGQVVTAESHDDSASAVTVRKFDASKRDYFTFHRDAKDKDKYRYQVSRPFKTITNLFTITVSRAIRDKEGHFKGVALVSLAPKYFESVLRQALPEAPTGAATLLNHYGDVIYRLPGADAYAGTSISERPSFQEFLRSNKRFTHQVVTGLDGPNRLVVLSKIDDSPLDIAASVQLDNVVAGWRHDVWLKISFFLVTAVLAFGLALAIQRRALARQAMYEMERRFRAYFERSMVGMATTSAEKGWIDVNPALCEMFGYSAEELSRMTWAELTYPDDLESNLKLFNRLQSGEINEYKMDKRFVRRNGDIVYSHLALRAVRKPDGTIDYLVTLVEDITEHKRAEIALQESEARLSAIFNSSPIGINVVRASDEVIIDINETALQILGFRRDEVIGRTADDLNVIVNSIQRDNEVARVLEQGINNQILLECRKKSGELIWIDYYRRSIEVQGEQCILGMWVETTEKKQAQEQLRKLAMAVEQSPESIVITNLNAEIEYVNEAFVKNTGYSREEAIGKNPRILNSGETPPETFKSLWDSLSKGLPWDGMFHNRRKGGSEYIEHAIITPIRQADGSITHYVAVKEDITDKKVASDMINTLAFYDTLTSLPNRRLLLDRLKHALAAGSRSKKVGALLFIDLDNFKTLNDTLGHDFGDLFHF